MDTSFNTSTPKKQCIYSPTSPYAPSSPDPTSPSWQPKRPRLDIDESQLPIMSTEGLRLPITNTDTDSWSLTPPHLRNYNYDPSDSEDNDKSIILIKSVPPPKSIVNIQ